ncbi:MAG: PHP domain-containing protein [Propioniciclava sp.]|uniref:PHP domain-containing protein n=1 Tax=Propioniciclava sp. TaxID=2038686 RepID=UPI0039E324B1
MNDQPLGPIAALREVARLLERHGGQTRRAQAFRRAADTLAGLDAAERAGIDARRAWRDLPGIGATTARVIAEAHDGRLPGYLAELQAADGPLVPGPTPLLARIRGDLHTHTHWSDGSSPIEEMALEAVRLGREWLAITDHSPRLRIANGLDTTRRLAQLARIRAVDAALDGFTLLAGAEVDILDDGALDGEASALDPLDVVVASVHSKLAMEPDAMTVRMVTAIANPRTNVLGHCTGRLVAGDRGTRAQSCFDAEVVFEACRQFGVAVEINSRPERCDPPDDLLRLAAEMGCLFAIDTDAHAPGQLGFSEYGAARAASVGLTAERIVTCWDAGWVRDWARRGR